MKPIDSPIALLALGMAAVMACNSSPDGSNVKGAGSAGGNNTTEGQAGGNAAEGGGGEAGATGGSNPSSGSGGAAGVNDQELPHRAVAEVCAVSIGPSQRGGADTSCQTDADCQAYTSAPLAIGHCLPSKQCSYDQCSRDEDCGATGVCSCQGKTFGYSHTSPGNTCVPANCRQDGDCEAGKLCSATWGAGPFYGIQGYYCHTPQDLCTSMSDCADGYCAYFPEAGRWACGTSRPAG